MPKRKCALCGKIAYPLESVYVDEKRYHKACFKCSVCRIQLAKTNFVFKDKLFCKKHAPVTESTVFPTPGVNNLSETALIPVSKCTFCGRISYTVESVQFSEKTYHRACFRCCVCHVKLNLSGYVYVDECDKLYCIVHTPDPTMFPTPGINVSSEEVHAPVYVTVAEPNPDAIVNPRVKRFIEFSMDKITAGQSLNKMTSFFSRVPNEIDLYEALVLADLDADFIINESEKVAKISEKNGSLSKYGMNIYDAQCVAMFTLEIPEGRGKSPYVLMNEVLSGKHDTKTIIKVKSLIVLFLRTIRKLPRVAKDVVYRGISLEAKNQLIPGEQTMLWGFTSTSTNPIASGQNGTLVAIKGPVSGYDIHEFSKNPSEQEFVLEPETLIQIREIENNIVQCEAKESVPVLLTLAPFLLQS